MVKPKAPPKPPKPPKQPALSFRIPPELFKSVKTRAALEGRSVSNYVTRLLRASLTVTAEK
jgi:predicted HicB family RNase H-like nuclease